MIMAKSLKANVDLGPHQYDITPESAHSAVLLLKSKEPEILRNTLLAIAQFAKQDKRNKEPSNCQLLLDLDAIQYILPHIGHNELSIRRCALKNLALLCHLPRGREQVLEDPESLRRIVSLFCTMEDIFILEFASLILSEVTKELNGCEQLLAANILSVIFNRMKNCPDPDVQMNSLQIISNLTADPARASVIAQDPQFSWPSILSLLPNKYVAIQQAAIATVEQLVSRYQDPVIQKSFRDSTGVLDLCSVLEKYEFHDIHPLILRTLHTYVETDDNILHVFKTGCIQKLQTYLEMTMPDLKPHCLVLFIKISGTSTGREVLFETGTDLIFCHQLMNPYTDVVEHLAMGVFIMTKFMPSAIRMVDTNIIEVLCDIISNTSTEWFNVRINALRALADLSKIIPKAAYTLVQPKTFTTIRNIHRQYKQNPIEAQRLAIECYVNLLNYHVSTKGMLMSDDPQCIVPDQLIQYLNLLNYHINTKGMLTGEFVKELLSILQRPDIGLKILTTNVLAGLMVETIAKYQFTTWQGEKTVDMNLKIDHVGLRTALCKLIIASVTYEGADLYLGLGTVHFMVENKQACYSVSVWQTALEEIYRHHPSAKLAYTGRLDIDDFTSEGFYVQKRLDDYFPTIAKIHETTIPPSHWQPVYVVMFNPVDCQPLSAVDIIRNPHKVSTSNIKLITSASVFLPKVEDVNLRTYLLKLKMWFGDPTQSMLDLGAEDSIYDVRYREMCTEVSSALKERAQVLAEYVCEVMSGRSQNRDCSVSGVNLHLADLMTYLNTPVLGLGWIQVGGALERALLYKVLADRIGLPCAFYRAAGAHAWCEVAVPDLPIKQLEEEEDNIPLYPSGLLRVNYVVDLTLQQGKLFPVGSVEARRICGPKGAPLYVARRPRNCNCEQYNNLSKNSKLSVKDK